MREKEKRKKGKKKRRKGKEAEMWKIGDEEHE